MVCVYCMWQSFQVLPFSTASDVVPVYFSAQVLLILLLRETREKEWNTDSLVLYVFVCLIELLHSFESHVALTPPWLQPQPWGDKLTSSPYTGLLISDGPTFRWLPALNRRPNVPRPSFWEGEICAWLKWRSGYARLYWCCVHNRHCDRLLYSILVWVTIVPY